METGNTVNREDIILDAMGGDNAPEAPVLGAVQAAKDFDAQITLVGRGEEILDVLRDETPEGMDPSEMLEEIEYSMERANDRQIGDAYWIVLSACD